jgi:uncharacterized membrane protein YqaE (UPF0057 family)
MHGGFMLPDMVTLLPMIAPLSMIAGFFAIFWDLFAPVFNIMIRLFELVPLLFNPAQLANEIITGVTIGLSLLIESVFGFLNPAKYGSMPEARKNRALDKVNQNCYSTSFMNLVLLIVCPPFAVFQALGVKIHEIAICTLLTIYTYYFPGLLYAILIISHKIKKDKNGKC